MRLGRVDRRVWLGAIVLLALATRLAAAGARLNIDDGYSWLVASAHGWPRFLDRLATYENTPPLSYLLLRPLPLDDEVWLRLPSIVAAVACVPVLYAIVRPLCGTRAALLAALGLAVAPYAISRADLVRGFMVATLALLTCTWAAARLAQGRSSRWWWLYGLGAVAALYTEYYAGLFLVALLAVWLAITRGSRRRILLLGAAPALAFAPWAHQFSRSLDLVGKTKNEPVYPLPTPGTVRDVLVRLSFAEHGAAGSAAIRTLQLLLIAAAIGAAVVALVRFGSPGREGAGESGGARLLLWLLGGTALLVLALHALTAVVGPDVFNQRYLIVVIPLTAGVLGAGAAATPWRPVFGAVAAVLVAAGGIGFANRYRRSYDPNAPRAVALVRAAGIRTILTNSAVVVYYAQDLHPILDRPFGLVAGDERRYERGSRPYAVIDDDDFGGARPGPGRRISVGRLVVRLARLRPS